MIRPGRVLLRLDTARLTAADPRVRRTVGASMEPITPLWVA